MGRHARCWSFTQHLDALGLYPSYRSNDEAYETASMDTFRSRRNHASTHIRGSLYFETGATLRAVLFDFLHAFYIRECAQEGLGNKNPANSGVAFSAA